MRRALIPAAVLSTLLLAACSGGGGDAGSTTEPTIPEPDGGPVVADMVIDANANSIAEGFTPSELTAPADDDLTLAFNNNDDGIPHNVQIFAGPEASGDILFAPENNDTITGVASVVYNLPPMEPGTYGFNCFVHPTMSGTLTITDAEDESSEASPEAGDDEEDEQEKDDDMGGEDHTMDDMGGNN